MLRCGARKTTEGIMIASLLRLLLVTLLAFQVSAAAAQSLSCTLPQTPMIEVELLFGRNIGGKLGVSEAQWRAFLAREVSPRFPDGLTVFDTRGQWRDDKTKALVREPGKIVRIILGADAGAMEKVDAVAAAYIKQFGQDSVGIVTRPACVVFKKP
jgi:hypothetical protein